MQTSPKLENVMCNIPRTPMNYSTNEIIDFLTELSGVNNIHSDSDIFGDIGMVGDDFHEMIEKYSKQFSVDLNGYLWYFHTKEEGSSFGGHFFKPPNERVSRITVTPQMLTDFANKGKWDIEYPEHILPKIRYDIVINKILFYAVLGGLAISLILKW